jgi:predicted AAA+ superfamily ATPase
LALECLARTLTVEDASIYLWGTHAGAELDLFWQQGGRNWGAEFKYLDAPRLTKSMKVAMEELGLAHLWVVYPESQSYRAAENATVLPLRDLGAFWPYPS